MSLKDDMAADVDTVFFDIDEFAEKAIYNGVEIMVIPEIGEGSAMKSSPNDTDRTFVNAIFTVRTADVPEPGVGDSIEYDEKTYQFAAIVEKQVGMNRIRFTADNSTVTVALGRL